MAEEFLPWRNNRQRLGCLLLTVTLALLNSACASWVSTGATDSEVQSQIIHGGLIAPGDTVKLATASGEHEFRVTAVDPEQGVVAGDEETVRISDIEAVEKREPDPMKTVLLSVLIGAALLAPIADDCSAFCFDWGP